MFRYSKFNYLTLNWQTEYPLQAYKVTSFFLHRKSNSLFCKHRSIYITDIEACMTNNEMNSQTS